MAAQAFDFNEYNPALDTTPLSVFEGIVQRIKARGGDFFPLHQGKTAFTTPIRLHHWAATEFELPPHLDGPTGGTDSLLAEVRAKLETQYRTEVAVDRITITSGITHALSLAFHCILRPGDEVIVLSPQWLFANGLVRAAGGVPVEVPTFPLRAKEALGEWLSRIARAITPRSRAIYFNTPNNPTGFSLPEQALLALAEFARLRGLWLVSDNAYEFYDFSPGGFVDIATLAPAADRCFSAYSFSKSYGLTGFRTGYLVAPSAMGQRARKFGLHSIYSVPTVCQYVALTAMRAGPSAVDENVAFVKKAAEIVVENLQVPFTLPGGGFYTLLDLTGWAGGVDDFISRCIDAGVSLAPGYVFGAHCRNFARLCFSVVNHERLREALRRINATYESGT